MDFPEAWDFVRETELDSHDPRCSCRRTSGALLCDCFILWDEEEARRTITVFEGCGFDDCISCRLGYPCLSPEPITFVALRNSEQ